MLVTQYFHRLPAGFDMGPIRERAVRVGAEYDAVPDLCFKAILVRERGRYGAAANAYSSLYLWQRDEAAARFVEGNLFRAVTDSFGRPSIETLLVLEARAGAARSPRSLRRHDIAIPLDADLAEVCARERERARATAAEDATCASIVALNVQSWRIARIVLSVDEPHAEGGETAYELGYLAAPGLVSLPRVDRAYGTRWNSP